jgi:hypothetical protein
MYNILVSFVCSASGTSAVAIDNKIEQAMVSIYPSYVANTLQILAGANEQKVTDSSYLLKVKMIWPANSLWFVDLEYLGANTQCMVLVDNCDLCLCRLLAFILSECQTKFVG